MIVDPRLEVVENVLTWHAGKGVRERAQLVLGALDEIHVHDHRGNLGWEDETEPEEG